MPGFGSHDQMEPDDLTGRLIKQCQEGDEDEEAWEVIGFPTIQPPGSSLCPEFWPIEELRRTRALLPPARWDANYQQEPVGEAGAIIKPEWWRHWPDTLPPAADYVVQSLGSSIQQGRYGMQERDDHLRQIHLPDARRSAAAARRHYPA